MNAPFSDPNPYAPPRKGHKARQQARTSWLKLYIYVHICIALAGAIGANYESAIFAWSPAVARVLMMCILSNGTLLLIGIGITLVGVVVGRATITAAGIIDLLVTAAAMVSQLPAIQ